MSCCLPQSARAASYLRQIGLSRELKGMRSELRRLMTRPGPAGCCGATGISTVREEGSREPTLNAAVRLPSRAGCGVLPARPRQQNTRRDCDEHEDDRAVRRGDLASPGERHRLRAGSNGDANEPDDTNDHQHG